MKVDIDGLKTEVKPQLEKAIKKLDEVKSKLTGIDIPDDFYFYSKLSNMPQDISNINENIKKFEKWLDGKISGLGNAESSNKGLIDSILSALFGGDIGNGTSYASGKNVADIEGKELVDTFWYTMFEGEQSDTSVLTMAYRTFYEEIIYNKNPEAEKLLKKVIEIKKEHPDFNFEQNGWNWSQSNGNKNVSIYYEYFDNNESYSVSRDTLFHELGHTIFALETGSDFPKGYKDIMKNSMMRIENDKDIVKIFSESLVEHSMKSWEHAENGFEMEIHNRGYEDSEQYKRDLVKIIDEKLKNGGEKELLEYLYYTGYEDNKAVTSDYRENLYLWIERGDYTPEIIAEQMISARKFEYSDSYTRAYYYNDMAIADMVDAVYLGEVADAREGVFANFGGHGTKYYENVGFQAKQYAFDELIANFTQLKISGNEKDLETVKVILGDECYNMLEETYNSFYN